MSSSTNSLDQNILLTPSSNLIENGQILNPDELPRPIIFLSGTTNYDKDETRWQQTLANALFTPSPTTSTSTSNNTSKPNPFTIIDPYNPAWDSTWREAPSDEKFVTQVNFELQGLELADIVVVGFIGADVQAGNIGAGGTTLVELGVALKKGVSEGIKVLVCVEGGFWKEGYVGVLCERFEVERFGDLMGLVAGVRWEVDCWELVRSD
ncbi:eba6cebe-cd4a-40f2-bd28-9a680aadbf52-CDS [Sclerotinia trifoliorum]|uniref:Eba6cebe-cd4a-40f2-bd28-9a680aadbf52-CDS n=1 Tax=Sclerotinia trifoliorum TaxID=28548 RepID=A0A8H2W3B2_9HELO|nr:eba6cebe-cd4a-40f2-bd28-9a680aadbf52-CDS [Sclerotinia trifoliorum]